MSNANTPKEIETRFLTRAKLMDRWGCSHMTIERLIRRDPDFPKAMRLGRLRLFRLDDVVKFERSKVVARGAA